MFQPATLARMCPEDVAHLYNICRRHRRKWQEENVRIPSIPVALLRMHATSLVALQSILCRSMCDPALLAAWTPRDMATHLGHELKSTSVHVPIMRALHKCVRDVACGWGPVPFEAACIHIVTHGVWPSRAGGFCSSRTTFGRLRASIGCKTSHSRWRCTWAPTPQSRAS
jgi:hypothetical protein